MSASAPALPTRPLRLGIVMSHPTQYHSPWFRELAALPDLELEVLYCFQPNATQQGRDFGVAFEWDHALLEGYRSRFLANVSRRPGFQFSGCDTPEIADAIENADYDAFVVSGWLVKSYWQAIRACWRLKVPMMVRGDSHLLKRRPLHVRIAKKLTIGRWIPRFAAYLTVGVLNEQYYEYYGADRSRFFPVRHFIDNAAFAAGATHAKNNLAELLARWRLPVGALIVLFAGKFIHIKRPMDVIRAVEARARAGDQIHLFMVGDGPLRAECQQYAKENDVPASFAGFLNQKEMPAAYACADVLVLSSTSETWGLVVNEAMACGVPVIITDQVGCGPDLIGQADTGSVYPVGDIEALAAKLAEYCYDREATAARGARAEHRVAAYNSRDAASNTLLALQAIAGGGS